jgi:hypothetical protein
MTSEGKFKKEQGSDYFRMLNLKSVTLGNKSVETVEEARRLAREKAEESAKKLKLKVKIWGVHNKNRGS